MIAVFLICVGNPKMTPSSECDMRIVRASYLIIAAVTVALFSAISTAAHTQEADIQTIYSTEKGSCGGGPQTKVEISEGHITGPGFECALSSGHPAGTGLVAFEGYCMVDGKTSSKGLALDLGNYDDHFELSLPGRVNWLTLYPCAPVPGLRAFDGKALPADEATEDPSLSQFRDRLLDAIVRRDVDYVVSQAATDIRLSFGGHAGKKDFRKFLTISEKDLADEFKLDAAEQREKYWDSLEQVLRMGGRFTDPNIFEAPYTWTSDRPDGSDHFATYFVISDNAPLRDRPSKYGAIVDTLSYVIVTAVIGGEGTEFLKVKLATGSQGFVHEDDLRSALDYRAILQRSDGEWRITAFISGD